MESPLRGPSSTGNTHPFKADFWSLRRIAGVCGAAILVGGMVRFSDLTAYLIISIALSFIGRPIVKLIDRINIAGRTPGPALGAFVALTAMFGGFALLVNLFVPLVAVEAQVVADLDFQSIAQRIQTELSGFAPLLDTAGSNPYSWLDASTLGTGLSSVLGPSGIGGILGSTLSALSGLVVAMFSIAFMTFFFLKDRNLFPSIVQALTPDHYTERIQRILTNSTALLTRYFVGLAAQVAIITTVITGGLLILGVPNAFLIGFLAGLLNLIPYVGPLIGAGLGLGIILTTHLQFPEIWSLLGKAGSVFLLAQLVDNLFTQPVIFAGSVKAHPLEIFLLISIAGSLAGITGMMLAIPAYSLLRVVAKEFLSGFKVVQSLTDQL
ncbi:MAG: AI-2E family transporter [Flavobacteriales bacterium]|jgi:predicted PurR-regulated permease PerM|nr:AI-2E family transporter [Flavobacteriales bacterium]